MSLNRHLPILIIGLAVLAVAGACDSGGGSGGGSSPAVDVEKISCGAGDLADYVECVAYGECYGRMCDDQHDGVALDACVGTGGELAIATQLGPACGQGDEAAIRLACDTGTAQLIAGGTDCAAPGGGGGGEDTVVGEDVAGSGEDTVDVDPGDCEGPCDTHMAGECLGTDYGCRCEYVDNEFGQAELMWVLSNCVEGDYPEMCRTELNGTPMCKPSADGTSAACECEM